jgi:hypothetical protein
MLEEELDPRPPGDRFAAAIAARAAASGRPTAEVADGLRAWADRDDLWVHLRTLEHWLARADV